MRNRNCVFMVLMLLAFASRPLMAAEMPAPPQASIPLCLYGGLETNVALYAPSGWMGAVEAIELDDACKDQPRSGKTCMKITFNDPQNWGGVVWQNPPNNWGEEDGGFNLTGARQIRFWIRGEKGTEKVEIQMGLLKGKPYSDSTRISMGQIRLGRMWKQYTMPIAGRNLSRVMTPFAVTFAGSGKPFTFYLDDIVYE